MGPVIAAVCMEDAMTKNNELALAETECFFNCSRWFNVALVVVGLVVGFAAVMP